MSERPYKHPQVNLRLPIELKDRIAELAEANGRSANAEMVAAIEAWVMKNNHVQALDLASIAERLIALEGEVAELRLEGSGKT
ncbi:Arc family DNA-binding protein [Serratia fonticola]|uniref:Arc family DNA-binding protein n=1 Tax=Serratia fonticola TaxID=47917 RepID=UPI003AFF71A9